MRVLAILIGALVLAAATYAAIDSAQYHGAHMLLMIALALGTAGGAVVLGRSAGRWALLVIPAVLAGEASGMLATAERIIRARESVAGVVVDAQAVVADRDKRIAEARADLAKHDKDALAKIAERHCADKCKALMDQTRAKLETALEDARALPIPSDAGRSPTPLADRLGIAPWLLDLIAAGLMTVGANGLAVILIAWGAHSPPVPAPQSAPDPVSAAPVVDNVTPFKRPKAAPLWGKFALEALEPETGGRVAVKDVVAAYRSWLEARGATVPPTPQMVDDIERVFRAARIKTDADGPTIYALDVKMAGKG